MSVIPGSTSRGWDDNRIEIASSHFAMSDPLLRNVIAHEFGHLIAFKFGSQSVFGAAPVGFPAYSSRPEEAWADCVGRALTGVDDASHGLPSCVGVALSWTQAWLALGPAAHELTA